MKFGNSDFIQFELTIGSLFFRQPICMWKYKSIRDLIKFSFNYFERSVCLKETAFYSYLYNLNFKVLTFPSTAHVQWCLVLTMHLAHVWICMYMYRMHFRPTVKRNLNRDVILPCYRVKFLWWSVLVTKCVPLKCPKVRWSILDLCRDSCRC